MPNLSLFGILIYVFMNFPLFESDSSRINPVSVPYFAVFLSKYMVFGIFDYIRYTVS